MQRSFSCLEGAVAHTTRGRDGRQEGRERGYYNLHRNLNETLFHRPCLYYSLFTAPQGPQAHTARSRDGRQEGRERGYYHLHPNLNNSLFHTLIR